MRIDLNCDLGESFGRYTLGDDEALLATVSSASIACGLHAGDPVTMARTVRMAATHHVAIGAHPGYPDLLGFGRRDLAMTAEELEATVLYQLGALAGFARAASSGLRYVKAHGALYNTATRDRSVAESFARAVAAFDAELFIVTLPGSVLAEAAQSVGLSVAYEGFADRAYEDDGALVPRSRPGAVIHSAAEVCARAARMAAKGEVVSVNGKVIPLTIDTLCIHGDTPGAAEMATLIRRALDLEHVEVAPIDRAQLGRARA